MSGIRLALAVFLASFSASCAGVKNYASEQRDGRSRLGAGAVDGAADSRSVLSNNGAPLKAMHVSVEKAAAPLGEEPRVKAFGLYRDGSVKEITGDVRWSTSDAAIAEVAPGSDKVIKVKTKAVGQVDVHAEVGELHEKTAFEIGNAELAALVFPGDQLPETLARRCPDLSPEKGTSDYLEGATEKRFRVYGIYSDCTRAEKTAAALWQSDNGDVAEFDPDAPGVLKFLKAGTVTIAASLPALKLTAQIERFVVGTPNPLGAFTINPPRVETDYQGRPGVTVVIITWQASQNAEGFHIAKVASADADCAAARNAMRPASIKSYIYPTSPTPFYVCVRAFTTDPAFTRNADNGPILVEP